METSGWTRLASNSTQQGSWAVRVQPSEELFLDVYLTDLASLWNEKMTAAQLSARFKVGPFFSIDDRNFLLSLFFFA